MRPKSGPLAPWQPPGWLAGRKNGSPPPAGRKSPGMGMPRWRRIAALGLIVLLTACSAKIAREGRQWAAGRPLADAESCLGIPAKTLALQDGWSLAQWEFKQPSVTAGVPLAALALLPITLPLALTGNVSISSDKDCVAIASVYDGTISALRFTGATDSFLGRDTACAPIVRGCVRMWEGKQ